MKTIHLIILTVFLVAVGAHVAVTLDRGYALEDRV